MSLNELTGELLERGLEQKVKGAGMTTFLPELEKLIKSELAEAVERIVRLQVRGALDAGTSRRVLLNFMLWSKVDQSTITSFDGGAYQETVRLLKEPLEDLKEIIDAADINTR